MNHMSVLLLLY